MFNTEVLSMDMQPNYTIEPHMHPNQFSTDLGPNPNLEVEAAYSSKMLIPTGCQNPEDHRQKIYVFISNAVYI
jgi:hypothetical protein